MKSRVRALFFLVGTVVIYLALFSAFAKSSAEPPESFSSLTRHVVIVLLSAMLVFGAGWKLGASRRALAAGVIGVIFYLLNPAVVFQGLESTWAGRPHAAFFAMAFFCAWLAMQHWSAVMRSIVLALVFAASLWASASLVWVILAMVPWFLFNRRPGVAGGTLATVALGGFLVYGFTWASVHFFCITPHALANPLRQVMRIIQSAGLPSLPLPGPAGGTPTDEWVDVLISLSPAWIFLAFWSTGRQLIGSMEERRSTAITVAAALAWIMFALTLTNVLLGRSQIEGSMTVFVALSAPIVARDLAQREFYSHRGVRLIVLWSFMLNAFVQWLTSYYAGEAVTGGLWRLWSSGVATLVALFVSMAYKNSPTISPTSRWQAILSGGALASYINVGYLLLKL